MKVAICVATRGRPEGLARLLGSLAALEPTPGAEIEVCVVDNDPAGAAQVAFEEAAAALPFPLRRTVEPRQGIPFARNAAVALAGDAERIAFVDDDETVEPGWLRELLAVQERTGADVVTGPVLPRFPSGTPGWVARCGAFDLRRHSTGAEVATAYTNNVLCRAAVFREVQPNFDPRLALTGGSDSHFFRRAHRAGKRIVWADEARVHEDVPASRARISWILRRAWRVGLNNAFIEKDLAPGPVGWGVVLGRAAVSLGGGLVHLVRTLVAGRAALVRGLRHLLVAAGLLAGLFGARYAEYETVHGR